MSTRQIIAGTAVLALLLHGSTGHAQRRRGGHGGSQSGRTQIRPIVSGGISGATTSGSTNPSDTPAVADARAHFERGLALLESESFDAALAEFERSYAINARPSVLYNIGVTLQSLRRYPDAARALERYLREGGTIAPDRRAQVERTVAQLRALIARVSVVVEPARGTVRIDGREVGPAPLAEPIEVGPGSHSVSVELDGVRLAQQEFTIASGETRTVRLEPRAVAAAPSPGGGSSSASASAQTAAATTTPATHSSPSLIDPSPQRGGLAPGLFIALSTTTGALAAGGVLTGVLTLSARAEFDRLFQDDPQINSVASRGDVLRTLTNVLFITSGVSAVAAIIVLTQTRFGPSTPRARAQWQVAPTRDGAWVGAFGTF